MKKFPARATRPVVHALADSARFARRLARSLGATFAPVRTHLFPDGETLVRVTHHADAEAILVQSFNDPDSKLQVRWIGKATAIIAVNALSYGRLRMRSKRAK